MLRDLPVRDLMITDVLAFTPDQNVQEAMRALVARSVGGGPVVDEDGRVVGVLSESDLIVEEARLHFPTIVNFFGVNVALPWHDKELDESVSKALGEYVNEVMSDKPTTVTGDATVEDAATLMHDKQVSRLPVVDAEGRLLGLLTRRDILRAIVRGLDEPGAYDAGDETPERLGEGRGETEGGSFDTAVREHRAEVEARHPRAAIGDTGTASADAADESGDFGADVGRI